MSSYLKILTDKLIGSFNRTMLFICLLVFLSILYKFRWTEDGLYAKENLWNPGWMIFGPLLYHSVAILKTGNKKRIGYIHFLPFLIVSLVFVYITFGPEFGQRWGYKSYYIYQWLYILVSFSLWGYSYKVLKRIYRADFQYNVTTDLLTVICAIYILIGILSLLMFLCGSIFKINMGFDYWFLVYALLLLSSVYTLRYFYLNRKEDSVEGIQELQPISYSNSILKAEVAENYRQRILDCFATTQIYLRADLSLDTLSKELDIPKHHFSQLFNVYFKKNFYNFIADYRINHALDKMKLHGGRLTIESLAYESGFNSKTSFNRYFKDITGHTPQEYQLKHFNFKS